MKRFHCIAVTFSLFVSIWSPPCYAETFDDRYALLRSEENLAIAKDFAKSIPVGDMATRSPILPSSAILEKADVPLRTMFTRPARFAGFDRRYEFSSVEALDFIAWRSFRQPEAFLPTWLGTDKEDAKVKRVVSISVALGAFFIYAEREGVSAIGYSPLIWRLMEPELQSKGTVDVVFQPVLASKKVSLEGLVTLAEVLQHKEVLAREDKLAAFGKRLEAFCGFRMMPSTIEKEGDVYKVLGSCPHVSSSPQRMDGARRINFGETHKVVLYFDASAVVLKVDLYSSLVKRRPFFLEPEFSYTSQGIQYIFDLPLEWWTLDLSKEKPSPGGVKLIVPRPKE